MLARTVFGVVVMMFVLIQAGFAGGKDDIQKYFNDTASKVKATSDPAEKRAILDKSLQTMSKALDKVQKSPLISKEDREGIEKFKATLQENQDELAGSNGYERVSDAQLNAFSEYVVQNMEQADKTITIGVVTALLIVIIIILLV
jgi:ABC-type transporter Mla subunit MlaD